LTYAQHGLAEHFRSWAFRLSLLLIPVLMVAMMGPALMKADLTARVLTVVVENPTVLKRVEEIAGDRYEVRGPGPGPLAQEVLYLEGSTVASLRPRLVVTEGDGDLAALFSKSLVRRLRTDAFLTEEQLALMTPPDEKEESQDHLGSLVSAFGAPMIVGMLVFAGALGGFTAASSMSQSRDEEFFGILRLGTPKEVIFLGGLLERGVLTGLLWAPLALVLAGAPMLAAVLLTGMRPDLAPVLLVVTPALGVCGAFATYLLAAAAGSVVGALSRGNAIAQGGLNMSPLLLVALAPLSMAAFQTSDLSGATPWLFVPGLGMVVATMGLPLGLGWGWVLMSMVEHIVLGLIALRAATWAYALDVEPIGALRRRFARGATS
jgi:hypothetical protein